MSATADDDNAGLSAGEGSVFTPSDIEDGAQPRSRRATAAAVASVDPSEDAASQDGTRSTTPEDAPLVPLRELKAAQRTATVRAYERTSRTVAMNGLNDLSTHIIVGSRMIARATNAVLSEIDPAVRERFVDFTQDWTTWPATIAALPVDPDVGGPALAEEMTALVEQGAYLVGADPCDATTERAVEEIAMLQTAKVDDLLRSIAHACSVRPRHSDPLPWDGVLALAADHVSAECVCGSKGLELTIQGARESLWPARGDFWAWSRRALQSARRRYRVRRSARGPACVASNIDGCSELS